MTDGVAIALIGVVGTLANTVILAYQSGHIRQIKIQTNGMSEKLGIAEHAAGKAEGKQEGAQEQRDSDQQNKS